MTNAKVILFSTVEATLFYIAGFYLVIDVFNLKDVAFWVAFVLVGLSFTWLLHRRSHFWLNKYSNMWCPDNRWYYHDDKNAAIFARWQGVIKQGEKECIERMENLQS